MKQLVTRTAWFSVIGSMAAVLTVLMFSSTSARADNFTFSFSNTVGNVSGTVTGEIFGLTNNATGPASEVLITSFPAGLDSVLGSAPIDVSLWTSQVADSFTETNGMVTGGGFEAQDTIGGQTVGAQLFVDQGMTINFLNVDGSDTHYVWNNNGPGGVTFDPASTSAATPEPSSLILLATGLAGAAGTLRRRFASRLS